MNIKVSIIVPVYNVEAYLPSTLDSLINQTLRDIEIICVNDGSTDNSILILNEYAKRESRITVIEQENRGLSGARNRGLSMAKGEYIYFMDSDDYLDVNAMEECFLIAKPSDVDIVMFDAICFEDSNYHGVYKPEYSRKESLAAVAKKNSSNIEIISRLLEDNLFIPSVCLNFIRRALLVENRLIFFANIIHEDELFTPKLYSLAKKITYVDKPYFHRRLRNSSIMSATHAKKRYDSLIIVLNELDKFSRGLKSRLLRKFIHQRMNVLVRYMQDQLLAKSGYDSRYIKRKRFYRKMIFLNNMGKISNRIFIK